MITILNALFKILFELLETVLTGIGSLLVSATPTRRNETYNADFGKASNQFSKNADGYVFGDMRIDLQTAYRHVLCVGNSGSGKSVCVAIPSALLMDNVSLLINDPSGEIYLKTSGQRERLGYEIIVVDFKRLNQSSYYNPVSRCKNKSDLKKLAKILVTASLGNGSNGDKFWNTSSEAILYFFLRYIFYYVPKEYCNIKTVYDLILRFEGSPKEIDRLVIETKDDELYTEYKSIIKTEAKVLANILSTVKAALGLWQDDVICNITSKDSISFTDLRKHKSVIYLRSSVTDIAYYAPLVSIFFEQFLAEMMDEIPKQNDLSVCAIMDECSSIYLPTTLELALANLRKFRVSLLCMYQAESQIADMYGAQAARSILANTHVKLFLPGQPHQTALMLEQVLGRFEFVNDDGVSKQKSLMSAQEIAITKDTIILIGGEQPIRLWLKPYFEQRKLRELAEFPPYKVIKSETDFEFQMIDDET